MGRSKYVFDDYSCSITIQITSGFARYLQVTNPCLISLRSKSVRDVTRSICIYSSLFYHPYRREISQQTGWQMISSEEFNELHGKVALTQQNGIMVGY